MTVEGQNQGGAAEGQNPGGEGDQNAAAAAAAAAAAGTSSWVDGLSDDLKAAPATKKFKGKDWNEVGPQVLKSYVALEKWQIPGENASPEEKQSFARRLGVPEKVDDYKIDAQVPEGVAWNENIQGRIAKFAHTEGIPPSMANKFVNFYLSMAKEGIDMGATDGAAQIAKQADELKTKWGADYKRNVGLVERATEEYGSESFSKLLDTQVVDGVKLGNHPVMLEFLRNYGETRLEGGFIPGDSLLQVKSDVLAEIAKIKADKTHPYHNDGPGHKEAVAHMTSLYARAYPDQKRA